MDIGMIVLIIIIVVVIAGVGFFILQRKKMGSDPAYAARVSEKRAAREQERQRKRVEKAELRAKRARYNEMITPEKTALQKARQEYNGRVGRAEDELKKLNRAHDKAIRDQEKAIADVDKRYTAQVEGVGGFKLYNDRIATRDYTVAINGTLRADIATGEELLAGGDASWPEFRFIKAVEGESKPTGAGTVVGGLGRPETQLDVYVSREMSYLFVYGTAAEHGNAPINICIPLSERRIDEGTTIKESLNRLAQNVEGTRAAWQREIEDAKALLEQIRNDTAAIEDAADAVERERNNRQAVEEAEAALREAEARAQDELGYRPER